VKSRGMYLNCWSCWLVDWAARVPKVLYHETYSIRPEFILKFQVDCMRSNFTYHSIAVFCGHIGSRRVCEGPTAPVAPAAAAASAMPSAVTGPRRAASTASPAPLPDEGGGGRGSAVRFNPRKDWERKARDWERKESGKHWQTLGKFGAFGAAAEVG